MISTLLQALALASVGLISPGSITLVILLLMSDKSWRNGVAFASAYLVMYSLIGIATLTLGLNAAENRFSEQSPTSSIILIGLGLLLLGITLRNWLKKPSKENNRESRFTKIVDGITPLKAFGLASLASIINFKNLAIFLSAVSVLRLSDLPLATQISFLPPVVLVFCTSVITPIAIYFLFPKQSTHYLTRIKETVSNYSRPLGITVTLILGTLFIFRGLSGLL